MKLCQRLEGLMSQDILGCMWRRGEGKPFPWQDSELPHYILYVCLYPSPAVPVNHWHAGGRVLLFPSPASEWPNDQKAHQEGGTPKAKGYFKLSMRHVCLYPTLPLRVSM